jgi:hypothetical protein
MFRCSCKVASAESLLRVAAGCGPLRRAAGKDAGERVELAPVFSNRSASFLKLNKVCRL